MPTVASKKINPLGFGMGSLTMPHKPISTPDAIEILKTALEAGANFWNAGLIYGKPDYNTLHILNAYFTQYPADADGVCISVKGCFNMMQGKASNDAAGTRASMDEALKILDSKCKIDIFEPCRIDPEVPVEETVGAIAEYVKAGKIGGVGLSECSAATIKRAAKVCDIAAVEIELSLFSTEIYNNGIAAACKELDIPIVAYSPLGKGFLTGQIRKYEDMADNDYRRMFPRFQPDAFGDNLKLVDEVDAIAKWKGCSSAQIAIAWVAAQSEKTGVPVVPIPGASNADRGKENATLIKLDAGDIKEIDDILERIEVKGGRYPAKFAHLQDG